MSNEIQEALDWALAREYPTGAAHQASVLAKAYKAQETALGTTTEALLQVCQDLACDDCCPCDTAEDFETFPECETCPQLRGPIQLHQDPDRDTACWARYYIQRAEGLRQ